MCHICVSWKGYSSVEFLTPQKKSHPIPPKTRNCSSCSAVTLKRKWAGIWNLTLTVSIDANCLSCCSLFLNLCLQAGGPGDFRVTALEGTLSWAKGWLAAQKGWSKVSQMPHRGLIPVPFWLKSCCRQHSKSCDGLRNSGSGQLSVALDRRTSLM